MKLKDIMKDVEVQKTYDPDLEVKKITAHPEKIEKDTLFILYRGINFDTRKIINYIIEKSPCAILTDTDIACESMIPIIRVKNARLAYAKLCYNFSKIEKEKLRFFAITGTNGKTTTATMLYSIFQNANIKSGFIGTGKILIGKKKISDYTYSMTTPDPEDLYPIIKRMMDEGCQNIVMEISSHALYLKKVAPLEFECAIFTNLSEEHLDFHENMEDYYKTKLTIFSQSKNGIFNNDDYFSSRAIIESPKRTARHSVGIINDADAMGRDIILKGFYGSVFIYREKGFTFKVNLNLAGEYNISNALMAIKCALLQKIEPRTIKESFDKINHIDGRLEKIYDKPLVFIDYAHTEKAMINLLKTIKTTKNQEQKTISVFGCGGDRDKQKRPRMATAAESLSDFVIVTSDNSRSENPDDIIRDIEKGFMNKDKYIVIKNRKEAIRSAILHAEESDIVLIIGKGHERYNLDSNGYHAFDERSVIFDAIKERQKRKE